MHYLISKALRYGPCVTKGSHSFTCHPHTNHTCVTFIQKPTVSQLSLTSHVKINKLK